MDTRYDHAASALADLKRGLEHQPMDTSFVYTTYINTTPERLWTALTSRRSPSATGRRAHIRLESRLHDHLGTEMVTIADEAQSCSCPIRRDGCAIPGTPSRPSSPRLRGDAEYLAKASAERRSTITFDIEPLDELVKLTVTTTTSSPEASCYPDLRRLAVDHRQPQDDAGDRRTTRAR